MQTRFFSILYELVLRELRARHKQSLLGPVWVVLSPLLLLAPLAIVFRSLVPVSTPGSYAAFVYTGLLPWVFFAEAVRTATESLVVNAPLVRRAAFPRSLLPLATVATRGVEHAIVAVLTLPLLYGFSGVPLYRTVLALPFFFLLLLGFTAGISLCTSVLFVYFRDVRHALHVLLTALMYATPILYTPNMLPARAQTFLAFNPMTWFLDAGRDVLLYGRLPSVSQMGILLLSTALSLGVGIYVFRKLERTIADVV